MVRILRERAISKLHIDYMSSWVIGGLNIRPDLSPVEERYIYRIESRGKSLTFVSLDQVCEALDWFSQKTHPSTRLPDAPKLNWYHPWHCRLPKEFTRRATRPKVITALETILTRYGET